MVFKKISKKKKDNITGEATPYYLYHPLVASRVYNDIGNKLKIIVILRNPVDRAVSHYYMNKKKSIEYNSFEEAILEEKKRIEKEKYLLIKKKVSKNYFHQHFSYLDRGRYVNQLKNWFAYFDRKQFLIIEHNDFQNAPIQTLSSVFEFLKISNHIRILNKIKVERIHEGKYDKKLKYLDYKSMIYDEFKQSNIELFELLRTKYDW